MHTKKILLFILLFFSLVVTSLVWAEEPNDPLECINRPIFEFNMTLDEYILEPAARGYNWLLPNPVKNGISNFFDNLRYPILLVSDLVQFKFTQMGIHTGRFLINSTIGIVGIFDVAEDWGLEPHTEDFGTALGYYGVEPGPYLMIPFIGPTNVRDGFGRIVDSFLSPTYYIDDIWIIVGAKALETVDDRRKLLQPMEMAKASSLDYYAFVRSTYSQVRTSLVFDGMPPEAEEEEEEENND